MIRPEQDEPIPGLYFTYVGIALRGRELGSGPYAGALDSMPEGVEEYLIAMGINPANVPAIAMGIAIGRLLPPEGR